MTNKCCGTCRYNLKDEYAVWRCANREGVVYGTLTHDDDWCRDWEERGKRRRNEMNDLITRNEIKNKMRLYGFTAPNMTVTEFVEDCLDTVR